MAKTKKKGKKAAKSPARARRGTAPKASSTEKALNRVELDIRKLQDKRDKLLTRAIREQEVRAHSTIKQAKKKAQPVWRILGEGDSWIRYTCGFGIMHHLAWMLDKRAACVNIGASGATMARMM